MNVAPFSIDPSATAGFAKLKANVDERVLRDTAAPVNAVVIGGGTGAPVSIRTLLSLEAKTSAVVAMADDGGSTGILREEAGVLPPGDIRKCLVAMAADENDPLTRAFRYRFSFARNHTLGNLMLSALEESTGSFPEAIEICSRLLNARGNVYPSTLDAVRLCAATWNGSVLDGQARASHSDSTLFRVWLESSSPVRAYEPALDAIREADLIVLGPGSLFTSIMPNLLVPGVIDAIRESSASTLFVCSLADQQGETRGMTALEHFEALCRHGMEGLIDYMLVHSETSLHPGEGACESVDLDGRMDKIGIRGERILPVRISCEDADAIQARGCVVMVRDLVDPERPTWHDPTALRNAFRTVLRLSRVQPARTREREVSLHAADAVKIRTQH